MTEADYDRLGYPIDLDPHGEEVPKTATISQESRQRAKCLSHDNQIKLRQEREQILLADQTRKVADKVNKYHSLLETNKKCEEMLAGANNVENFSKCTVPQLTAYIHVREFRTTQAAGTDDAWKWPNKGKLEGAQAAEDNLISRAFERRNKDIRNQFHLNRQLLQSSTPDI